MLAGEGRLTLQVPCIAIGGHPQLINAPDSWFCFLKSDGTPCIGKQRGFLYLTEEGYNVNYNDLKTAFEASVAKGYLDRTNGVGWPAFKQYARDHFANVRAKIAKSVAKKQKEIAELQAFVV